MTGDDTKLEVTWEQVLSLARKLQGPARNNAVPPEDGARLALLVIAFHENLSLGVRRRNRD
jgi:hypothetical protein